MDNDWGEKIKDLRIKNGLTQEELADRAELTKGYISQLERNLCSPSIATFEDILRCLGCSLCEFFADKKDDQLVFSEDDYFLKEDPDAGTTVEWLIPNAQKNRMEPVLLTLAAHASSAVDQPHEGEEFGYVLQGAISLHIGQAAYAVRQGESFYFSCDQAHYISSAKGAKILWVSAPPSF